MSAYHSHKTTPPLALPLHLSFLRHKHQRKERKKRRRREGRRREEEEEEEGEEEEDGAHQLLEAIADELLLTNAANPARDEGGGPKLRHLQPLAMEEPKTQSPSLTFPDMYCYCWRSTMAW